MTLALSLLASLLAPTADWPMYRHDPQLTGRQPVPGAITQPAVLWSVPLAVQDTYWTVGGPPGGAMGVDFALGPPSIAMQPGAAPQPFALIAQSRVADLLPDVPGLEEVVFEDQFSGFKQARGRLYTHEGPERKQLWETEPEEMMFLPLVIFADATGDGLDEVCVATWYRVMVYDSRTGAKLMECRYHNLRNYGWFGSADIDGDGVAEFVTIADFASHVDVLDNDGKELSVLWRRDIEPIIGAKEKSVRVSPGPVFDANGDGRLELVFNLFSDTGDGRWHVVAIDARTGETTLDLPGQFLRGHVDFDGNGTDELLLVAAERIPVPDFGSASVLSGRTGAVLASFEDSSFATREVVSLPLTENTGAADGKRTALTGDLDSDGRPEVLVQTRVGTETEVSAVGLGDNGVRVAWRARAPELRAVSIGEQAALLSASGLGAAPDMTVEGAKATWYSQSRRDSPLTSPIVLSSNAGRPLIIAETALETVTAFHAPQDGAQEVLWSVPGRGMADSGNPRYGVVAANLVDDALPSILIGRRSPEGGAELAAVDARDGSDQWVHDFPDIPGGPSPWNIGCLTYWWPVWTGAANRVFASVRRSTMHSDEGHFLDGETGETLWSRPRLEPPEVHDLRGCGGKLVAAADLDGDGREEIVCCYSDMAWIGSSLDGRIIKSRSMADSQVFGGWTAYATPIVADFLGDGGNQILWGGCTYATGLLSTDLEPLWTRPYADAYGKQGVPVQAIGRFDDSGAMQTVEQDREAVVRCFTASDGKDLWSLPLGAVSGSLVSCDIDGDGRDEAIAMFGAKLVAVGAGEVDWSLDLPAPGFTPALADVDGDGRPEVLVMLTNGDVVCVGPGAA